MCTEWRPALFFLVVVAIPRFLLNWPRSITTFSSQLIRDCNDILLTLLFLFSSFTPQPSTRLVIVTVKWNFIPSIRLVIVTVQWNFIVVIVQLPWPLFALVISSVPSKPMNYSTIRFPAMIPMYHHLRLCHDHDHSDATWRTVTSTRNGCHSILSTFTLPTKRWHS